MKVNFGAVFGAVCVALLFLPLSGTPFLQDDYVFLYKASEQAENGRWRGWLTETHALNTFWRPVSVGLYWQFVHHFLAGSAVAAHVVNALILGLASAAGGTLGTVLAAKKDNPQHAWTSFWATLLFGISGCWLLPVVWACAVQETLCILFSAAALLMWIAYLKNHSSLGKSAFLGAMSLVFLTLALLSKEGAAVVPALGAIIAAIYRVGFSRRVVAIGVGAGAITLSWLLLRSGLTSVDPASPYAPTLGSNILQNGIALVLFMLNFPREAMTGWLQSRSMPLLLWGVVCFALQTIAVLGFVRQAAGRLPVRTVALWVAVALLPYLVLRSQCYPYYACMALLTYPWLVASAFQSKKKSFFLWASLAMTSSGLLYLSEPFLPLPAPIARAHWSKQALDKLSESSPGLAGNSRLVSVEVKSDPAYAAGGYLSGPALALGISQKRLIETEPDGTSTPLRLRVDMNGYQWVTAERDN